MGEAEPIKFSVRIDGEDGLELPLEVESLFGTPTDQESVLAVCSIPFLTDQFCLEDLVRVTEVDGRLWFRELVNASAADLYQVLILNWSDAEDFAAAIRLPESDSAFVESLNAFTICVRTPQASKSIQELLVREHEAGRILFKQAICRVGTASPRSTTALPIIPYHTQSFICGHVLRNESPILWVDRSYGDWVLGCGEEFTEDWENNTYIVGIGHLLERDPSLRDLVFMRTNQYAERDSKESEWEICDIDLNELE